tara:strand:- start:567 stop:872 length:306 start_codon:yes stop_codon:yes gene_type:complete
MNNPDCRLKNYRYEDENEYDSDGVAENTKRWHKMDDHNGETHYLDISPYVHLTPEDTKAFTEIAIRIGRVPTRHYNNGVNFDSESIAYLLRSLEQMGQVNV